MAKQRPNNGRRDNTDLGPELDHSKWNRTMKQKLCSWPSSQTSSYVQEVQRGGRKADRMNPIPEWQWPDRWVMLSCATAHSQPDGKCPLLPTTLILPPAHLKALDLGLSFQAVLSGPARGLKGSLIGSGWPQMRPPSWAEQSALSWLCSEVQCIPTASSGTLSKHSQFHRKLMRRQSLGPWLSPQTISNYQGGLECPLSCRALLNSAFIDSPWQAGMIFLAPISPKARQPRNMSLNEWAISASWPFPIELYLFCIMLHCCLEVFASALNFPSSLILLSEYHDWIVYSRFCALIPNMLKKKLPFLWGLCNRDSELHFLDGGIYGFAWQLKGIRKGVADPGH